MCFRSNISRLELWLVVACSRLRDSRVPEIEKARTWKENESWYFRLPYTCGSSLLSQSPEHKRGKSTRVGVNFKNYKTTYFLERPCGTWRHLGALAEGWENIKTEIHINIIAEYSADQVVQNTNNATHCMSLSRTTQLIFNDTWNKSYMNCGNETKMKKWSSQWTQFMQLHKEAWKKKIQDPTDFVNTWLLYCRGLNREL